MKRKTIAEIRREEIITAFISVMSKKGYKNATIREVTEVAGFSQGMLHHYFKNKQAMILGVLDYITTLYIEEIEHVASKKTTPTNKIKEFLNLPFKSDWYNMDYSRVWMEFWMLSKNNVKIQEIIIHFYRTTKKHIASVIQEGVQSNEFRKVPHDAASNLIIGSIEGVFAMWVADPNGTPYRSTLNQLKKMVLRYLTLD